MMFIDCFVHNHCNYYCRVKFHSQRVKYSSVIKYCWYNTILLYVHTSISYDCMTLCVYVSYCSVVVSWSPVAPFLDELQL